MRSAKDVYKKLKEVKFKRLVILYRKFSKKTPENCRYNCKYIFTDQDNNERTLRLCLMGQPHIDSINKGIFPQLVDICQEPQHATHCESWVQKYSKEEIQEIFQQELDNSEIKNHKYPDIAALEWVLEKSALKVPLGRGLTIMWQIIRILSAGGIL